MVKKATTDGLVCIINCIGLSSKTKKEHSIPILTALAILLVVLVGKRRTDKIQINIYNATLCINAFRIKQLDDLYRIINYCFVYLCPTFFFVN